MRTWEQYETEIELRREEHMRACKTIDSLRDQLAASEAKAERLREACEEILIQSEGDDGECRICGGDNGSRKGHESNCAVARAWCAVLASTEPGK